MIVDYIKFKKLPLSSEMVLFFIHGNPRNISNELEHDILNFYKKLDYKQQTYVIDDDSQTDIINNSYFEQSLFDDKKIITLNIVSNSIPKNLKVFIETVITNKNQNRIIIKLDRQPSSFKNTKFYKHISSNSCLIELYELKGKLLEQWVINKCKINKISHDDQFISNLIELNFNNSLSISQTIYQKSLMDVIDKRDTAENSKYGEYDLVDTLLNKDYLKFLKISNYLQSINSPLTYIIFLLNSELEKLYLIQQSKNNKPFIPQFLQTKYNVASSRYTTDSLLNALKNIVKLDINSKYNSKNSNSWASFNDLFSIIMNNNTQV
ncbi:MAG: DNA polymerase III subunit delta [Gammaproteobacteria bacterium]